MNLDHAAEIMLDPTSSRSEIARALEFSASSSCEELERLVFDGSGCYLVGTGYDFSEFGASFGQRLSTAISGIACIWTEVCPYPFPSGDKTFSIPQEFIEPEPQNAPKTLVLATSVIAEKFEVLTILSRMMDFVNPDRLVIVSAAIDKDVERQLNGFFTEFFGTHIHFVEGLVRDQKDLWTLRQSIASKLDDRPNKVVPLMSEWLFARRFGPRPSLAAQPTI